MADEFHDHVMDEPQIVSSLLELCCIYVTNNFELLFNIYHEGPSSCSGIENSDETPTVESVKFKNGLPRHLYQPIFDCLVSSNGRLKTRPDIQRETFCTAFMNSQDSCIEANSCHNVLWNLNLRDSDVIDNTLYSLLKSHRNTCMRLDLTNCQKLSTNVHRLLTADSRLTGNNLAPCLLYLNLTGCLRLFLPWLRGDFLNKGSTNCKLLAMEPVEECLPSQPTSLPLIGHLRWRGGFLRQRVTRSAPSLRNDNSVTNRVPTNRSLNWIEFSRSDICDHCHSVVKSGKKKNLRKRSTPSSDQESVESINMNNGDRSLLLFKDDNQPSTSCTACSRCQTIKDPETQQPIITMMCPDLAMLVFRINDELINEIFEELAIMDDDLVIDRDLVVWNLFSSLLAPISNLKHLDISGWPRTGGLLFLRGLNLTTLILHDVQGLGNAVDVLCTLNNVETLDLSQSAPDAKLFSEPVMTLSRIVASMPKLTSLDISGTNLASNPKKGDWPNFPSHRLIESDIYGLQGLKKKLDFLGILRCDNIAHYKRLPAFSIAGDASELQLLTALECYMDRPHLLLHALNEIFIVYKFSRYDSDESAAFVSSSQITGVVKALHLLLKIMPKHNDNVNLLIAASASLFYVLRPIRLTFMSRQRILTALLAALDLHTQDITLVRNCCLSFCHFDFVYSSSDTYLQTFRVLLKVLRFQEDQMIIRLVVFVLNSMACTGQADQKTAVGDLGSLGVMMGIVRGKWATSTCDEVMETAWSFMWNITDETPANCRQFLKNNGMDLFKNCYRAFSSKNGLIRNMMGLIGNIAEVEHLRYQIVDQESIRIFCKLLTSLSDGIEISYNSAGVLANLLSTGRQMFRDYSPTFDEVADAVINATDSWDISAKRYINYRSFVPIIRLLRPDYCYAAHYWALWALANLTTVDGAKYCQFVLDQGGVQALDRLSHLRSTSNDNFERKRNNFIEIIHKNMQSHIENKCTNPDRL